MTEIAIRDAIVAEIERARAAWATYTLKVEYPNKDLIDLPNQTNPYLAVDIVFMGGEQLDLGLVPQVRDRGRIVLAAGVKEGAGQRNAISLLEYMKPYLQLRQNLSGVNTHVAVRQGFKKALGWHFELMSVGFWADATAPAVP